MLKRIIYTFLIALSGVVIIQIVGSKKLSVSNDEFGNEVSIHQGDGGDSDCLHLWFGLPEILPVAFIHQPQAIELIQFKTEIFQRVKCPKYILYQSLLIG
jgi:hypothetical protein